jgi:hypothetical protein
MVASVSGLFYIEPSRRCRLSAQTGYRRLAEHVRSAQVPGYFRHQLVPLLGSTKNKPLTAGMQRCRPAREGLALNFENGTVHGIRSVSQRALTESWARLCKEGLPSFDQFDPEPGVHDPKQLAVWKAEVKDGQLVFRALYRGRLLDEAFNEGWAGKTLREVTPPSLQPAIIGASDHCVRAFPGKIESGGIFMQARI